MPDQNPIRIDTTPFVPVLITIVTKILVALGAFLVAHGLATEGQVNAAAPPLAQEIVGALIALAAMWYSARRTKKNNENLREIKNSPQTIVPDSIAVMKGDESPQSVNGTLALVPILFVALAGSLLLSGCATLGGDVRLNANKAFLTAQISFKSVQQTTLAVCSVVPKPAPCDRAIDLLSLGAQAEDAGFTAQQSGNAADLQTAITTLTNLPPQLVALGILKAN